MDHIAYSPEMKKKELPETQFPAFLRTKYQDSLLKAGESDTLDLLYKKTQDKLNYMSNSQLTNRSVQLEPN